MRRSSWTWRRAHLANIAGAAIACAPWSRGRGRHPRFCQLRVTSRQAYRPVQSSNGCELAIIEVQPRLVVCLGQRIGIVHLRGYSSSRLRFAVSGRTSTMLPSRVRSTRSADVSLQSAWLMFVQPSEENALTRLRSYRTPLNGRSSMIDQRRRRSISARRATTAAERDCRAGTRMPTPAPVDQVAAPEHRRRDRSPHGQARRHSQLVELGRARPRQRSPASPGSRRARGAAEL